jgi:hypothetical protein
MLTKTVRSRFNHEVGQKVEGCTILERTVIIPPDPTERRLGVYDYLVEVAPIPVKPAGKSKAPKRTSGTPEPGSFTRSTPEGIGGGLIRRVPSR